MNKSSFQQVIICILSMVIIVLLVFYGYRPVSYDLSVGSVSNRDIYAHRSFVDTYQTEYEAVIEKNSVSPIFIRSEEISQQSITNVELFYNIVSETRSQRITRFGTPADNWDEIVSSMYAQLNSEFTAIPDEGTMDVLLSMSYSAFNLIMDKSVSISEIIMMDLPFFLM